MLQKAVEPEARDLPDELAAFLVDWPPKLVVLLLYRQNAIASLVIHLIEAMQDFLDHFYQTLTSSREVCLLPWCKHGLASTGADFALQHLVTLSQEVRSAIAVLNNVVIDSDRGLVSSHSMSVDNGLPGTISPTTITYNLAAIRYALPLSVVAVVQATTGS